MARGRNRKAHHEWSDGLPPELLGIVLLYLPCLADRACFATVCRAWCSAARDNAPPRQLPWLLLPRPNALSYVSLQSGTTRRLKLPDNVRDARLCGSHGGGWVTVAAHAWGGHAAVNLLSDQSDQTVPLPNRLRLSVPKRHGCYTMITSPCEYSLLIRSVVFSAAPTSEGCLAAAHVASATNLAFLRPGTDAHWTAYRAEPDGIEDMVCHRNERYQGFHVLTSKEDVVVYIPGGDDLGGGQLEMSRECYHVEPRADYLHDLFLPMTSSIKRYLVESRGKLLMVLRLYNGRRGVVRRTHAFRIFEMKLVTGADGFTEASWVELDELTGRALFLGRGCSMALEVSQFDGLQEGSIYYLDDTSFDVSVALDNGKSFSSADMGMIMYRMPKTGARVPHFPRRFASESSPPIWFAIESMEKSGL